MTTPQESGRPDEQRIPGSKRGNQEPQTGQVGVSRGEQPDSNGNSSSPGSFSPLSPPPEGGSEAGDQRPGAVTATFWLGIACVVVGFAMLGAAYLFITEVELRPIVDEARSRGRTLTMEQARWVYVTTYLGALAFAVVLAALWITVLVFLRRGRNWARIVLALVAAAWLGMTVPSLFGTSAGGVVTIVLSAVQVLVLAATLAAAFAPGAHRFFVAR